ncbi:endonuclease/exonuclease/phosphatase family protein [Mesonia aquimarina]|uniref:endonuclease/exonuclease/phosphatase family protein n=1 Tax=Mesonia aquimarina TaxID=1504967 RepID=UPI000EF60839|nr:endonuclease/exonuclease/phosphatase family protein [Mesonia aquimarina]
MKLKNVLVSFGVLAIILTIIPLFTANFWWIRIFDFPHGQLTALTLFAILFYFFKFDIKLKKDYGFILILSACFIFQMTKIVPYTPFSSHEIKNASSEKNSISILASNVLQKNNQYQKLKNIIAEQKPDLVLLMEANETWRDSMKNALTTYPYRVECPLENTYGMLLYSKKELINPEVNFLISDTIPSINSKLKMDSGKIIQLYATHPTPPSPQHNPRSTDRDGEMMLIAKKARKSNLPILVIGDFNDVAWSKTTQEFQEISGLLDPRVGRGFYSTYNANNFLLRWPLDHIFSSNHFTLSKMKRLKDIDSDHFPIYAKLNLEKFSTTNSKKKKLNEKELEKINKEIKKAKH